MSEKWIQTDWPLESLSIMTFLGFSDLICNKMSSEYAVYDEQFPTDHDSLKGILSFFVDSEDFFAIELKETGELIGYICLNYGMNLQGIWDIAYIQSIKAKGMLKKQ